ncbi:MAG: hypothetical protein QXT19_03895 [Candidatus Woesearchaeota archaeon]
MEKGGLVAVFLAVLLTATIGVFVILTGPSTTGQYGGNRVTWWEKPKYTPDMCGAVCFRNSDCIGKCNMCSPSLGRCIAAKDVPISGIYSWRNYALCQKRCNRANLWCHVGARNNATHQKCDADLPKCIQGCNYFSIPEGKTPVFK